MHSQIQVIIIDDHQMVLQGLTALLNTHPGISVIKTFTNGHDAISELNQLDADVILTDINMPVINGFDTAKGILALDSNAKIIMLSMEVKKAYVDKAMNENIFGYISKSAPIEEVVSAIKKVYTGEKVFDILDHLAL